MRSMLRLLGKAAKTQPRRVVFTCLFGYSEAFSDQQYEKDYRTDFICFTDDRNLRSDMWTFRYVDSSLLGPVRTAKMIKIMAHSFLGAYETSIYHDNTLRMVAPYEAVFAELERSASPMVTFRHLTRSCVYEEAETVKRLGYDDAATIDAQMKHYRSIGHPENAGLIATGFQARRHNDPELTSVMLQWFLQVCRYSYRDQLSFNVVARRMGFEPTYFPGPPTDKQNIFRMIDHGGKRLPRDFRDDVYLKLHEDVRQAGISPREHYLKYGMAEGRSYKPDEVPPDFHDDVYLELHADVRRAGIRAKEHYLTYGMAERRAYKRSFADLTPAERQRMLPPDFRDEVYLDINKDVRRAGMDAQEHYLTYGKSEGRPYKHPSDRTQT